MPTTRMPPVQYEVVRLTGGLDLVTPTLSLPPGVARDALNFEVSITGGYTRMAGYERFDGRPAPSAAIVSSVTAALTAAVAVGDTVTGATSGVTGLVIARVDNVIVMTRQTGTFIVGETLRVGGVAKGTITALGAGSALTVQAQSAWAALAADAIRPAIGAVPGAGPIRGVAYYNGTVYAWRNNVGNTALGLYKSSASGWQACSLGYQLAYGSGTAALVEGNTIVGGTSGATAVVTRVTLESGSWGAGTAAGRVIFSSVTGAFVNGEVIKVGGVAKATTTGASAAITLLPNGRVETALANFTGSGNIRLYGVDGVNPPFEFDGTVYVPLATGLAVNAPSHVTVHKQQLFVSYRSSILFSALGDPYNWTTTAGAGEIGLTEDVTAFLVQPGDQSTGALAVYTDSSTYILYGTSAADYKLVSFNLGTGGKAYSAQNMGQSFVFDDRGVINLTTTLNYGNFDSSALSLNIRPFVQQRRNLVTGSLVNREKSQYRVFFSDGFGLYTTIFNNQMLGSMPVQFPNPVQCICEGEQPDGSETAFFGSTNGYVYRLDAGTSFDGEPISANLTLVFDAIRSPRVLKRFRKAALELSSNAYTQFNVSYNLGYASDDISQDTGAAYAASLSASYWDAASWDTFIWDGRQLAPSEIEMRGTAENVAVKIDSRSAEYQPFTINSLVIHYSLRRGLR